MIIGRKKEIKMLEESYNSNQSTFVAVYGRRRIGKTYLINETFQEKIYFRHAGIYKGSYKEQLIAFSNSLKNCGYKNVGEINNWFDAFEELKTFINLSKEKKKILFIDEIAWMYTKNTDFIKVLENFYNSWVSARHDIMLIICSSVTSWIINNIIHSKGGLYNRVTDQIHIEPFTLKECEEYSNYKSLNLSRKQIIEAYMVIGGVPYYWNYIKKGESIPQFIDDCFFNTNALLKNELKYIFSSLFNSPDIYLSIIEKLSKKKYGLTRKEIIEDGKLIDNGNLTQKLKDLINCGFIREYSPIKYQKKLIIYQLIDPFTIFHFHFLTNKVSDDNYWQNQLNTSPINTWKGLAFERICLLHYNSIKKALGISGVYSSVYPWSCQKDLDNGIFGSQIDMIIERSDGIINLIEIKYYDTKFLLTSKQLESIYKKKHDFIELTHTKSSVHLSLISLNGLIENKYSKELQVSLTCDDLFL